MAILRLIPVNWLRGCDGQAAHDGTESSAIFHQSVDLARYASPGSLTRFDAVGGRTARLAATPLQPSTTS